jgi:1,4-alpha-glucan branching enzyme
MSEIAADAPPRAATRRPLQHVWPWLAAAAVLAAVVLARPWTRGTGNGRGDAFQFVLVAPQAASVSLVGDFNDWDPARAPMQTAHGVWATVVPLAPGRYRYAFLVNGVEWRADPGAPHAMDDEFGTPSSVVTVGGRGS